MHSENSIRVLFYTDLSSQTTLPFQINIRFCVAGMNKMARAIAAYEATGPNQLSLNVGDVVHVYNTNATGWSEAEIERDGSKVRGWCPTNYLKVSIFGLRMPEITVFSTQVPLQLQSTALSLPTLLSTTKLNVMMNCHSKSEM